MGSVDCSPQSNCIILSGIGLTSLGLLTFSLCYTHHQPIRNNVKRAGQKPPALSDRRREVTPRPLTGVGKGPFQGHETELTGDVLRPLRVDTAGASGDTECWPTERQGRDREACPSPAPLTEPSTPAAESPRGDFQASKRSSLVLQPLGPRACAFRPVPVRCDLRAPVWLGGVCFPDLGCREESDTPRTPDVSL